jgi:hypothetical protein
MPIRYHISVSDAEVVLSSSCDNYYILAPGELLVMQPSPAWCGECKQFTEAEWFDTVEAYDQMIKRAAYYADRPGLIQPEDHSLLYLVGRLPDLRRRRTWRAARQSPPKCIQCGSSDVVILDRNGDHSVVPCLGRVDMRVGALISSEGPCCHFWYFTPEGVRVRNPPAGVRRWSGQS